MPPHGSTMPAPMTESAREARKAFYCDLCGKGYSRINEFEAHEGSYDHLHKKRLKAMKSLSKDPTSRARALKAEARANEASGGGVKGITIKPIGGAKAGSFKKGGFKNAFGAVVAKEEEGAKVEEAEVGEGEQESETDEETYDPREPTGCGGDCPGR